jgi:ElaB/YqjD/DUF883 family membrane-anchored ribosome-binding protein
METTFDNQTDFRAGNGGKQSGAKKSGSLAGDASSAAESGRSEELRQCITEIEQALGKLANATDSETTRIRRRIEAAIAPGRFAGAREAWARGTDDLAERARRVSNQADEYVHDSPWQAVGIGAAVAALVGMSLGFFAARR